MIVFDLDGVLRDVSHRLHFIDPNREEGKDWKAFFNSCSNDTPIDMMLDNLFRISRNPASTTSIWTGSTRTPETLRWLSRENIFVSSIIVSKKTFRNKGNSEGKAVIEYIRFRSDENRLPEPHLKKSWLKSHNEAFPDDPVTLAIETREENVLMWEQNGVNCIQVEPQKSEKV